MAKQKTVVARYVSQRKSHLAQRNQKIWATRVSHAFRWFIGGIVVLMVLGIAVGIFGVVAYTLKNGGKFPGLESTPLRFLVKTTPQPVDSRQVIGLPGVPAYPHSEFVFESYINQSDDGSFTLKNSGSTTDQDSLYRFLTSGQSVYRLPLDVAWDAVASFYKTKLETAGWKFELSVPISDVEKVPGEYYSLNDMGLHIYYVSSDIWYEKITKTQAEQGLRDRVVAYKAKQELVLAASGKDLSSDTGWVLKYSRDWTLDQQNHPTYGKPNLYFTHDKSKERVLVLIVKQYQGNIADVSYDYLDKAGTEYLVSWLSTQPITVTLSGFTKTQREVGGLKAMEFSDAKHNAYFLFLVNTKFKLVYVILYNGNQNPEFYEYIKNNMKGIN